jgi:hypothetical protein
MFLKNILPVCLCALWLHPALAEGLAPTGMITGPLGLNTVPTARMDEAGTVRMGVSLLDPYVHAFLGFQLADSLYIQLRQTAEVSDINQSDRLYPGVDIKLRLMKETGTRPEMSLGLQSFIGHKRMASEYLAASKRYKDFDFTAGIGWGRFASGGHLPNPLKGLSDHFSDDRTLDGEMPNEPNDWFTGDDIGLFGGVEYSIPKIKGLSAKFDWGQDRYEAEKAAFRFEEPPPWSIGLAYKPFDWLDMNIAALGTDKIMARLTLAPTLEKWPGRKVENSTAVLNPHRTSAAIPAKMELAAVNDDVILYNTTGTTHEAHTKLKLDPFRSTPGQFGQAAIHMANYGGRQIEEFEITPTIMGLRGPKVRLMRKDFEKALIKHQGSAEEIWRHASFVSDDPVTFTKNRRPTEARFKLGDARLVLEEQMSLSEEDSGVLTRTSLIAGRRRVQAFGFLDSGIALRLNLYNNLDDMHEVRLPILLPVRSDVDQFAENLISLDEFYTAFTHSFRSDLHLSLIGGYLEEMYGGFGGEILYRPFGPRYAFSAELWEALKRGPSTALNLGFNGDHLLTGYLNAWYDIPKADLTLHAKIGRYLAEDFGGTFSLQKKFKNGATLEGFITVTNEADLDVFGGTTHARNGVRLTLPLGGQKYIPDNTAIKFRAEPFGRDTGQSLENPVPLYETTEAFSYSHMIQNWDDILPRKNPAKEKFGPDKKRTAF